MKEKEKTTTTAYKGVFVWLIGFVCVYVRQFLFIVFLFLFIFCYGYYNRISATTVTSGHDSLFVQERAS